jgi:hypothetical protein
MNKQQTLESLKKQLPSFYSLEQVIEIINGIEEDTKPAAPNTLSKEVRQELTTCIMDAIAGESSKHLVDFESAEFELEYNNTISLCNVDIDYDHIETTVKLALNEYAEKDNGIVELERHDPFHIFHHNRETVNRNFHWIVNNFSKKSSQ